MFRVIAFFVTMLTFSAARAAEIADVPVTESNYVGIIVFLVVMVGSCVWFFWKIMRNSGKAKQEENK